MNNSFIKRTNNVTSVFAFLIFTLFQTSVSAESLFNTSEKSVTAQLETLLNEHQGKVVYVDFWASWCAPCRKSFPVMNKWHEQFSEEEFKIITINVDARKESAIDFLKTTPANFHIIYDPKGELAQVFNVKGMPSSYIFGRDGQLISSHTGFDTFKGLRLENELKKLLVK